MKKKPTWKRDISALRQQVYALSNTLKGNREAQYQILNLQKHLDKLGEVQKNNEARLEDAELHLNLVTRLLTTICIEHLGMRLGEFRRLTRRMEKDHREDHEISYLNDIYSLEPKLPTYHKRKAITSRAKRTPPKKGQDKHRK